MTVYGVGALPVGQATEFRSGRKPVDYRPSALVASCGYERRSTHIARLLAQTSDHLVVAGFPSQRVLHYKDNLEIFAKLGADVVEVHDDDYRSWLHDRLKSISRSKSHVVVDISSMSRPRMAAVVSEVGQLLRGGRNVIVDLLYSPSTFVKHDPDAEDPLAVAGPVTSDFAGWSRRPEYSVSLIVGLGYEPNRASVGIDLVEPVRVWAFAPMGLRTEEAKSPFDSAVIDANAELLARHDVMRVDYPIDSPFQVFSELFSLVSNLQSTSRPLLLPLGPKIFACVCMLVSAEFDNTVAVWRLSAGEFARARDAVAAGPVIGLRASGGAHARRWLQ